MKRIFTFCLLFAFLSLALSAQLLSPEQALDRAMQGQNGPAKAPSRISSERLQLATTIDDETTKQAACYVFTPITEAKGFMIVSADELAQPVLAYSDEATFDPNNIPPNMAWFLDCYAREIAHARQSFNPTLPTVPKQPGQTRPNYEAIPPKLTTKWNQDLPYCLACPGAYYQGDGPYYPATGCVATAMAQVLNYHKWPEQPTGSHSYTWSTVDANNKSVNKTLSLNFDEQYPIFWDYMQDEYVWGGDASNPTNAEVAVALLMYYCGIAADMQYGADASGTSDACARRGLSENLGYTNCRYLYKSHFPLLEWEEMCYKELRDNGPLYYSGSGAVGGHAFVLDGYSYNGYFHFNWGWGGMSDGFFQLSALAPAMQGIGGNEDGFNDDQGAMFDMYPNRTGAPLIPFYEIYTPNNVNLTVTNSGLFTKSITIKFSGQVWSNSNVTHTGNTTLGFKLENQANKSVSYISSTTQRNWAPGEGYNVTPSGKLASTENATYHVYLVYKLPNSSEWLPIKVGKGKTPYAILTVSSQNGTISYPDTNLPTVEDINLNSGIHDNCTTYYSYTIINTSEDESWEGSVIPMLIATSANAAKGNALSNSNIKAYGLPVTISLAENEQTTVNYDTYGWYNISNNNKVSISGNYDLAFCTAYKGAFCPISNPIRVSVTSVPATTDITFTVGEPTFSAVYGVGMQHIYATVPVHVNSGFGGAVFGLVIYEEDNAKTAALEYDPIRTVDLSAVDVWTKLTGTEVGYDQEIEYACEVPGFHPSKNYYYSVLSMLNAEDAPIVTEIPVSKINFADGAVTGVENISADNQQPVATRLYNLAGVEVTAENPAPGLYIEVLTFADGSTQTRHKLLK